MSDSLIVEQPWLCHIPIPLRLLPRHPPFPAQGGLGCSGNSSVALLVCLRLRKQNFWVPDAVIGMRLTDRGQAARCMVW